MTNRVRGGSSGSESRNSGFRKFPADVGGVGLFGGYSSSRGHDVAGGVGEPGDQRTLATEDALVVNVRYIWNSTPAVRNWSTAASMSPTGKFSTVKVAGS